MRQSIARLIRFGRNELGTLAVSFAITTPALLAAVGMATDYAFMSRYRSELQAVADAAAIAGARELSLVKTGKSQVVAVVKSSVRANSNPKRGNVVATTVVDDASTSVQVSLSRNWTPFFAHFFFDGVTPVRASATARVIGSGQVCVIGLDSNKSNTVFLTDDALLTANGCDVYANSTSSNSLFAGTGASLKSDMTCTAGGFAGSSLAFDPLPVTDCPQITDPLIDRAPPPVGACSYENLKISGSTTTLAPGVYCGGITVSNASSVTFTSGIYVIKAGVLNVDGGSRVTGANVGFYLTDDSTIYFHTASSIDLTAPKDGNMAGLLFFEDRNATAFNEHKIESDDARVLLGTIYLPQGRLLVEANKPVADQSAYTAIVARTLELKAGPNLVLNADYASTDVPLPSGLQSMSGGRIALIK